jgi:hypothetical protein
MSTYIVYWKVNHTNGNIRGGFTYVDTDSKREARSQLRRNIPLLPDERLHIEHVARC